MKIIDIAIKVATVVAIGALIHVIYLIVSALIKIYLRTHGVPSGVI